MAINNKDMSDWIGQSELRVETLTDVPIRGLGATLDHPAAADHGAAIPPLWHWLYFLPSAATCELAEDGHPRKGGFLPPIPKPRRMWAGSRLQFLAPLTVGAVASRVSKVAEVTFKEGRSGAMYFVKVVHETWVQGQVAVLEEQDLVYRDPAPAGATTAPRTAEPAPRHDWTRRVQPSAALLFRYSALTFNSHRIHYDRSYATEVEGYPGLVVHGPLLATLMLDLVRKELPDAMVLEFTFRAQQPVFDTAPFTIFGTTEADQSLRLWVTRADGAIATVGTAKLG